MPRTRKKTKRTGGRATKENKNKKIHTPSTVSYSANEDIIQEILSKVPTKSIVRFKGVSKEWLSKIEEKKYVSLHGSNPCICVTVEGANEVCLLTTNLSSETVSFVQNQRFKRDAPPLGDFEDIQFNFSTVNGLTCLYDYDGKVCIYNPTTGQMTPWTLTPFMEFEYFDVVDPRNTIIHPLPRYMYRRDI
ncbi:F-box protein At1g47340-like [Papaver somniferum]|uniref:F-box protein At1g47340-like n=1 Tax=Papaver somniferum TaxID=3469 RepID=UPI000E6FB0C4|nr:F-box protein At1g47340-like [Papaver somniferum]